MRLTKSLEDKAAPWREMCRGFSNDLHQQLPPGSFGRIAWSASYPRDDSCSSQSNEAGYAFQF